LVALGLLVDLMQILASILVDLMEASVDDLGVLDMGMVAQDTDLDMNKEHLWRRAMVHLKDLDL